MIGDNKGKELVQLRYLQKAFKNKNYKTTFQGWFPKIIHMIYKIFKKMLRVYFERFIHGKKNGSNIVTAQPQP